MEIKIKLINNGTMPQKQHEQDACFDCYANEELTIEVGKRAKVPLGFALQLPGNWEAQIRPRSGLSSKGIDNCLGTVDANYRGEVCAIICNNSNTPYEIKKGDRICQMAIRLVMFSPQTLIEVSELDSSERGVNGFGSTGK